MARIEPKGYFCRGQRLLRIADTPLHPGPVHQNGWIVWVHRLSEMQVMFGAVEVTPHQTHVAERRVYPWIVWIERKGLFSQSKCLHTVLVLFPGDAHRF